MFPGEFLVRMAAAFQQCRHADLRGELSDEVQVGPDSGHGAMGCSRAVVGV
jgi:hypothetical protein